MSDGAIVEAASLPALVQRAADALLSARDSAEVLDARDLASAAYHAAKIAGRMARAKGAHDALMAKVHRAQADALLIEARAKARLADEYDAAQKRGEVAGHGGARSNVDIPNVEKLGIRRDEIHDARRIRDAEASDPGVTERALDAIVSRGDEPTRAALKREIAPELVEEREPDPYAFRKMTREGLIAEATGLRREVEELRQKLKARDATITDLKQRIAQLSEANQGAVISRLHREIAILKLTRDDAMAAAKREEYKRKMAERPC